MKTIEEFYKEIVDSSELQNELKTASNEMLSAFLKEHGCDADVKGFMTLLRSQNEGEIEDENADTIAGGQMALPWIKPPGVL